MCFSAEASFTLSAGLVVIGAMALRQDSEPRDKPMLAIPLVFAAQQFTEGLLWLILETGYWGVFKGVVTHGFLIFAQVIWPAFIAPAIYIAEDDPARRRALKWMIPYGIVISLILLGRMILWPYEAEVLGHSIRYASPLETNNWLVFFYAVAVVLPLLTSSRRAIMLFGGLVILAFIISHTFYLYTVISVWCFFAAGLSVLIYVYARQVSRDQASVGGRTT